jgi:hypothetical protein
MSKQLDERIDKGNTCGRLGIAFVVNDLLK